MPRVCVVTDARGEIVEISSQSPATIGEKWTKKKQGDATLVETTQVTFKRPVPGILMMSEESITVHSADFKTDNEQLNQAYNDGYADAQGRYHVENGQNFFLQKVRFALVDLTGEPDAFLCMLLATHDVWKYHYPTFGSVQRWLNEYTCPEELECVKQDLHRVIGTIKESDTAALSVLSSLDVRTAMPSVETCALDVAPASATRVLSALLANGQRLPTSLPKAVVPSAMLPAFRFIDEDHFRDWQEGRKTPDSPRSSFEY